MSEFLRLDRSELSDGKLVVRAAAAEAHVRSKASPAAPLGYLYGLEPDSESQHDLALSAGHYDAESQVWVFSGELTGIIGITEPYSAEATLQDHCAAPAPDGLASAGGDGDGRG